MVGGEKIAELPLKLEIHPGGGQAFYPAEDTNENSG